MRAIIGGRFPGCFVVVLVFDKGVAMKSKSVAGVGAVVLLLVLSGCQSAPQKNTLATTATKCAPIHNLSQEKRKACTSKQHSVQPANVASSGSY